ncbi:MAG: hypothetical protein GX328_03955, partial [Clostridiaceae bacterium]|nr:hypothetical protein [Clostridiaceae bacterium]
ATLIIDGKEITVEIDKKELEKLEEKPFPQEGDKFYLINLFGEIMEADWEDDTACTYVFHTGNYFKTREQARNKRRADYLEQKIAVRRKELNGGWELDFSDSSQCKYYIYYYPKAKDLDSARVVHYAISTSFGYYKDKISAQKIIDEFHDDLIWYFTEYIPEVN